jgi:hypothetical protein
VIFWLATSLANIWSCLAGKVDWADNENLRFCSIYNQSWLISGALEAAVDVTIMFPTALVISKIRPNASQRLAFAALFSCGVL